MQKKDTTEETYIFDVDNTNNKSYIIVWILLICTFIGFIIGSYFFFSPKKSRIQKEQNYPIHANSTNHVENIHSYTTPTPSLESTSLDSKAISPRDSQLTPKVDSNEYSNKPLSNKTTSHNTAKQQEKTSQSTSQTKKIYQKPKLVIIIDDLANPSDIKKFQSLGLKLNLSLFPKQFFSQENPKIAKTLDFYMIHLPLEAQNFEQQGVKVLRVGDSLQTIDSYITEIKRDFPKLKYLNNHTGSRYTESKEDMKKFLNVLKKHHITFVDSRTTAQSVAKDLLKDSNTPYLARNIFLDNQNDTAYITKQLQQALKIADKKGYVIMIGHPKKATYKVLQSYKNQLLQNYTPLYINELEKILQDNGVKDSDTALPINKENKPKQNKDNKTLLESRF